MRLLVPLGNLLALAALHPCGAETINFDRAAAGVTPAGWSVAKTHQGGPPKWEVLGDSSAPSKPNVLAQVSDDRTAGRFPLAIWDGLNLKDGSVTVKFKAVSGTVDQGAGLVWRYRDPNNYYIVRVFRLSWKWRERSTVKITERTLEETKKALHRRRESRHPEAAFVGPGAGLEAV